MFAISKTRQYRILSGMKQRCYNPSNQHYKYYGERGITVCDEWLGKDGARNFYEWSLSNGYADNLTIDRVDNNLWYCPSNCIWAESVLNTSHSVLYKKLAFVIRYVPTYESDYIRAQIKKVENPEIQAFLLKELASVQRTKSKRHRNARSQNRKKPGRFASELSRGYIISAYV